MTDNEAVLVQDTTRISPTGKLSKGRSNKDQQKTNSEEVINAQEEIKLAFIVFMSKQVNSKYDPLSLESVLSLASDFNDLVTALSEDTLDIYSRQDIIDQLVDSYAEMSFESLSTQPESLLTALLGFPMLANHNINHKANKETYHYETGSEDPSYLMIERVLKTS